MSAWGDLLHTLAVTLLPSQGLFLLSDYPAIALGIIQPALLLWPGHLTSSCISDVSLPPAWCKSCGLPQPSRFVPAKVLHWLSEQGSAQ